jgi:hypothetical protein
MRLIELERLRDTTSAIANMLVEHGREEQAAILAELVATWLACWQAVDAAALDKYRERRLREFANNVRRLIKPTEARLIRSALRGCHD